MSHRAGRGRTTEARKDLGALPRQLQARLSPGPPAGGAPRPGSPASCAAEHGAAHCPPLTHSFLLAGEQVLFQLRGELRPRAAACRESLQVGGKQD